jgi:hypothetical protein
MGVSKRPFNFWVLGFASGLGCSSAQPSPEEPWVTIDRLSPSSEEVVYIGHDKSYSGLRDGVHLEGEITTEELSSLERVTNQERWTTYATESLSDNIRNNDGSTSVRVVIRGDDASRQVVYFSPKPQGLSEVTMDLFTVTTGILNAR